MHKQLDLNEELEKLKSIVNKKIAERNSHKPNDELSRINSFKRWLYNWADK